MIHDDKDDHHHDADADESVGGYCGGRGIVKGNKNNNDCDSKGLLFMFKIICVILYTMLKEKKKTVKKIILTEIILHFPLYLHQFHMRV